MKSQFEKEYRTIQFIIEGATTEWAEALTEIEDVLTDVDPSNKIVGNPEIDGDQLVYLRKNISLGMLDTINTKLNSFSYFLQPVDEDLRKYKLVHK